MASGKESGSIGCWVTDDKPRALGGKVTGIGKWRERVMCSLQEERRKYILKIQCAQ